MRKVLLLVASLILVTVSGWALHDDFYNRVLSFQTQQYQLENHTIGQPAMMLAGNNMITDGQQPGADLFGMQAAQPSHSNFYNAALVEQVEGYKTENEAKWAGPTLLAGNNMITGRQASPRGDFYNRVLSAKAGEFKMEKNSIETEPLLLANMITGEQVFSPEQSAPEDFYNQQLSAQVDGYLIDNNALANTEFAESPSSTTLPGSMASNLGQRSESDWYSRTVAAQAELNRRLKKSQTPNTF
jgi:hypothetical protein